MKIMREREKQFTTFEAANICNVFHTTVINWVNQNKLKAYYTPGGHRRILHSDLLEFMRKFEMPVPMDLVNRSKKILIVEDDAAVARVLTRALLAFPGLETQLCRGGLEALMAIGQRSPEILVLDIRIPQVNGLEVLKLLRSNEQTKPIKVIVISGQPLTASEEKLVRQNADCFLRKPLSIDELKSKVAEYLELAEVFPELKS